MDVDFMWYVMESDGNGAIRKANITTGPYYDETRWFSEGGYLTSDEAKAAIVEYCKENVNYLSLYIIEGT